MLQANELRLDNLVMCNDRLCRVRFIGATETNELHGDVVTADEEYHYPIPSYGKIQPIPLTPELWRTCGFKHGHSGYWFKGGIEYNPEEQILAGFGYCYIEHLHQLQNLYFAFTGEELKIDVTALERSVANADS